MTGAGEMAKHATAYARRGIPVFPLWWPTPQSEAPCACGKPNCANVGKHPIGELAPKGLHSATTDLAVIARWWRTCPDANVAIPTGAASGVFVLDVDPRHGGDESLYELERRNGELPEAPEAITGSGGRHIVFAHPGREIRNSSGKLGPGLDVRGDGGYIVAPPSLHASGQRYRWDAGRHIADLEQPPAPGWMLAALIEERPLPAAPVGDLIPAGARNATLASLAGSMRRRGMAENAIAAALLIENIERCDPPLAEAEVREIAHSVSRYPPMVSAEPAPHEGPEHEPEPAARNGSTPVPAPDSDETFRLTDLGNAERLVGAHGGRMRHVPQWGWLVYDGRRWLRDPDAIRITRLAQKVIRSLYRDAAAEDDTEKRVALAKHATGSERSARLAGMVSLARSLARIEAETEHFDRDPWLLNAMNGTLDLRTGELRHHRSADLLTKVAPVAYEAEAECPRWLAFLSEIMDGNDAMVAFLRRAVGYSLTGSTRERVLFICHGGGANGKSTFIDVLAAMLGDYAQQTPARTLLTKRDTEVPTDIARLSGARFVSASESAEGKKLDEGLVKHLTGDRRIAARFMRQDSFEFRPEFKLWLGTNHKPDIRGTDRAIWDRIRLIPFTVRIEEGRRDAELAAKLGVEAPGILAWAVAGCLEWQREGLGIPPEVADATEGYRREMDVIGAFLDEHCALVAGATTPAGDLYAAYRSWCESSGEPARSQKDFGGRLSERGFENARIGHAKQTVWRGIGLLEMSRNGQSAT